MFAVENNKTREIANAYCCDDLFGDRMLSHDITHVCTYPSSEIPIFVQYTAVKLGLYDPDIFALLCGGWGTSIPRVVVVERSRVRKNKKASLISRPTSVFILLRLCFPTK